MTYPINKTDGSALITPTMPAGVLQDGVIDASSGVTLIGRNYPSYGEIQNENFIKLLQNFANDNNPSISQNAVLMLPGTLWFDTTYNTLKVYDGTDFIVVSQKIVANAAPTASNVGDQWWDTVNNQLRSWTGTQWQLVGPAYTASQYKTGPFVETITDTTGNTHTVVTDYTNNRAISVTSYDALFTVNSAVSTAYTNFTTIQPGINLSNIAVLNGTATNSNTVGSLSPTVFARNDIATSFASDVTVAGNISFNNANLYVSTDDLILQNKNSGGNVEVFMNTTANGNVRAMSFSGATGQAYVYSNPIYPMGVANKGYVDAIQNGINANLGVAIGQINSNVTAIQVDYRGNISSVITTTNANLSAVQSGINANVTAANAAIITANAAMLAYVNGVSSTLQTNIDTGVAAANTMANLAVASLNSVLNSRIGNLESVVSTTVLPSITTLNNQVVTLTARLIPLANIASPTFTGTPLAPTPAAGDNTTKIATTAFVTSEINSQKFNYTVSASPPTGGADGDFWFQIG